MSPCSVTLPAATNGSQGGNAGSYLAGLGSLFASKKAVEFQRTASLRTDHKLWLVPSTNFSSE